MSERVEAYADAFWQLVKAEGNTNEISDELFRFSRVIEGNDELRTTLADQSLPASRREQIVLDLLGGKAFPTTIGIASLLVTTGRIAQMPEIVELLLNRAAAVSQKVVAQVRSAVELTADQKERLAASLKVSTGKEVEVVVIVDPTVLGGLITQIGDTVIDGSVRHRLAQLRESF